MIDPLEELRGCAGWLRDMAVAYRGDAEGIVGGMRSRMIADADDCDRCASALERLGGEGKGSSQSQPSGDAKSAAPDAEASGGGEP